MTTVNVLILVALLLLVAICAAACYRSQDISQARFDDPSPTMKGRIEIVSFQYFKDGSEYTRQVVILKDTKTGKEYLAIRGYGVTEMYREIGCGGKCSRTVEEEP